AVALPLIDPGGDAVAQILAVGVDIDQAGPLERLERGNRCQQLHAIVGRVRLAAFQFLAVIAERENRPPSARTGIAGASAVGVDDNVRLAHPAIPSSLALLIA